MEILTCFLRHKFLFALALIGVIGGFMPGFSVTQPISNWTENAEDILGSEEALTAPSSLMRADSAGRVWLASSYGQLPLCFEANQGQTNHQVTFLSRAVAISCF
jgi:hypothetical protein